MAKVLYSATMSLDGYIAGPGGDMSWLTEHFADVDEVADGLVDRIGAILCGNVTYGGDDPNRGTDSEGAFGGQYDGPAFVLTHRPPTDPVDGVEFVGDLATAVEKAKTAAGDKYVNILGADVARQAIEQKLVDEILVFVAPALLGDGVRLLARSGGVDVKLEKLPDTSAHWYRIVY